MSPPSQPRMIWVYAAGLAGGIVLALGAQAAGGSNVALNPQPEPPGVTTTSAPAGETPTGQS